MTISDLPALNAALNALSTVLLLLGFAFIKTGRRVAHQRCMIGAVVTSAVFLVTYVTHKILVKGVHTPFGGEGAIRICCAADESVLEPAMERLVRFLHRS